MSLNATDRRCIAKQCSLLGLALLLTVASLLLAGRHVSSAMAVTTLSNNAGSASNQGIWVPTGILNTARYDHTATLLPTGNVLAVGGWGDGALASAELYDPVTEIWTFTGSLNTERYDHTATLLPSGQVLVAGGGGGGVPLASAELYDPTTGIWTFTGSLNTARFDHTATLLSTGNVLIAGGRLELPFLDSAELYDPATGIWTFTGNLNTDRSNHTATLLPTGNVLVAGGWSPNLLASAQLYVPFLENAIYLPMIRR